MKKRQRPVQQKKDEQGTGGGEPTSTTPAPPNASGKVAEVLARKAKRICETLGIDVLAKRYDVEPTAEAVASAYAATYPPIFQTAVHDGCRSAFPG